MGFDMGFEMYIYFKTFTRQIKNNLRKSSLTTKTTVLINKHVLLIDIVQRRHLNANHNDNQLNTIADESIYIYRKFFNYF
jgi:hypothetical protein